MSQISILDEKMKHTQTTIQELEKEREIHLHGLLTCRKEQEKLKQDENDTQSLLNETNRKLKDLYELKKETDVYYKHIQQSVDTLLALLTTSTNS